MSFSQGETVSDRLRRSYRRADMFSDDAEDRYCADPLPLRVLLRMHVGVV